MAGKILVAEDDPEARELLLLMLGSGGYQLLEAEDGMEALDILCAERPDLLITDIVMPRMDGYELVRKLRQDERVADTPVIFCSASYHEREVRAMAQSLGVFTLSKPFDVATVQTAVLTALNVRPAHTWDGAANVTFPTLDEPESLAATRARLESLVAFSRRLLAQVDASQILEPACREARGVLLAQCAELAIEDGAATQHCCASGLPDAETNALLGAQMYRKLLRTVESGGCAQLPMSAAAAALTAPPERGAFASMLAVPIASGTRTYGYLSVVNRIGLAMFTELDLAIARAIAAQVAVAYENARRHQALEEEIAQRAAAEEEVRHLNAQLEQRVIERTAELRVANRELEAFTYSVAHDLRAPLRLIDAHGQMAREASQQPATVLLNHVTQIQRGAAQMSSLIDGLLALARVSHMEMNQEPTSLEALARRAVAKVAHETAARHIDWNIGQLPVIPCDPELLLQVFVNLLSNAAKYTRPRSRAIIDIGLGTADGQTYVYIRDNGVGFDMRYASKLFGVFQRLHRQDQFEGTGIGLATVSRIIERHHGRIWAESAVERGAVFRFTVRGLPHI